MESLILSFTQRQTVLVLLEGSSNRFHTHIVPSSSAANVFLAVSTVSISNIWQYSHRLKGLRLLRHPKAAILPTFVDSCL